MGLPRPFAPSAGQSCARCRRGGAASDRAVKEIGAPLTNVTRGADFEPIDRRRNDPMPCVNHADRDSTAKCVTCNAELCDECRTEVDGKNYCAKDLPQPAAAAPPSPGAAPATSVAGADDPSQEQPIMAALSYIVGILAIIILVTDMKKSRYMRFHGFQALFMIVVWIAFGVVAAILQVVPIIGTLIALLGYLALIVLGIILAVKAYNKQELELPVITKMAREQADKMRV